MISRPFSVYVPIHLALFFSVAPIFGEEETVPAGVTSAIVDTSFELPWTTRVITGASTGKNEQDGFIQVLAPVWSQGETMVFVNPQMSLSSNVDPGFSMGLGVRRYVVGWDAIIGANLFFDREATVFDNHYNQLGLGFEILTETVDFRFNYYLPDTGAQDASFATSTAANRRVTEFGTPFATQNTVSQQETNIDQQGRLNQIFEGSEDAMEGFDMEVGFLVPVLQELGETRLYGGLYSFDNTFGDDFVGAKARAELRLSSKLVLETNYFEDGALYGDDWTFGFRLNLPIEDGPGGLRKMFSGILGRGEEVRRPSSLAVSRNVPASFSSSMMDRMGDQAMRNSFVQTSNSGFTENRDKREFVVESATSTSQVNVLSDSVVFVGDPSAARGAATPEMSVGTFEDPVATIQEGINLAASSFGDDGNVVVSGELSNYVEDAVDAGSSVKLWGGGRGGFPGQGGKTLPYFGTPTMQGGFTIDDVDAFSVSGFDFVGGIGGSGNAFYVEGTSDVRILDNRIEVDDYGLELYMGAGSFEVRGNQFIAPGDDGIYLGVSGADGELRGVIAENMFIDAADAAVETYIEDSNITAEIDIIGNQFIDNDYAVYLYEYIEDPVTSNITYNIKDNFFQGGDDYPFYSYHELYSDDEFHGKTELNISGNTFIGSNEDALAVEFYADADSYDSSYELTVNIKENSFEAIGADAIFIDLDDDVEGDEMEFTLNVAIENNEFRNIDDTAITVLANDYDFTVQNLNFTLDVLGNKIVGTGGTAISNYFYDIDDTGVASIMVNIADNEIEDVGGDGIYYYSEVSDADVFTGEVNITGNKILNTGGDGIYGYLETDVDNEDASSSDLVIANNTIIEVSDSGVEVKFDTYGSSSLIIGGNFIQNAPYGVYLEGYGDTVLDDGVFGNNVILDSDDEYTITDFIGTTLINGVERP